MRKPKTDNRSLILAQTCAFRFSKKTGSAKSTVRWT